MNVVMLRRGFLGAIAALLIVGSAMAQPGPLPTLLTAVNVKAYGAQGNTTGVSSCSISAAGTALTCSAASFTASDVGKQYYLQGSGAANVPQFGTIAGYVSATSVTLSQAAVVATPQSGIYCAPASCPSILAAGSGYTNGTQTLTITGDTCTTQPQLSVTVAGNVVTAVLSHVTAGVCTVVPPSGSATTCGTGPTVATGSSWQRGSVIVPSTATACTLTWPATLPSAPFCTVSGSNAAIAAAVTSTSTTTLVAGFSADMAGATMRWNCSP